MSVDSTELEKIVELALRRRQLERDRLSTAEVVEIAAELGIPEADARRAIDAITAAQDAQSSVRSVDARVGGDALSLVSRYPGIRLPMVVHLAGWVSYLAFLIFFIPGWSINTLIKVPFWIVAVIWPADVLRLITTRTRIEASDDTVRVRVSTVFSSTEATSLATELDVGNVDHEQSGKGVPISPILFLPIKIGGQEVEAFRGLSRKELRFARDHLIRWRARSI